MTAKIRKILVKVGESIAAICIGIIGGAILMLTYRYDPIVAYRALLLGAFGDIVGIYETLAFATPLMLTALTFGLCVRSGLFNIGAEGQMYMGAIGAVLIGGAISLPPSIHLAAATLFGMLLGGLWGMPAAMLKITRGVHEVVSTIMLNWIAFWLVTYLITYHLTDPLRAERAIPAQETARYTVIGGSLTTVFPVAVFFALFVYFLLWRTTVGYELRVVGYNPDAAKYAGINISKAFIISFFIGGLAAGLAGASQVLGRPPSWTVYATLGNLAYLGFEGLGVSLIGRNHPVGIVLASIFYGGLLHGGRFMEFEAGVASEIVRAINGIIIVTLAIPELYGTVMGVFRRRKE